MVAKQDEKKTNKPKEQQQQHGVDFANGTIHQNLVNKNGFSVTGMFFPL